MKRKSFDFSAVSSQNKNDNDEINKHNVDYFEKSFDKNNQIDDFDVKKIDDFEKNFDYVALNALNHSEKHLNARFDDFVLKSNITKQLKKEFSKYIV